MDEKKPDPVSIVGFRGLREQEVRRAVWFLKGEGHTRRQEKRMSSGGDTSF